MIFYLNARIQLFCLFYLQSGLSVPHIAIGLYTVSKVLDCTGIRANGIGIDRQRIFLAILFEFVYDDIYMHTAILTQK